MSSCRKLIVVVGALIIARHAFGGTIATQTGVISLAIQTTFTLTKGVIAIRNLRIDEHRMWMIRTWGVAASVRLPSHLLIPKSLTTPLDPHHQTDHTSLYHIFNAQGPRWLQGSDH